MRAGVLPTCFGIDPWKRYQSGNPCAQAGLSTSACRWLCLSLWLSLTLSLFFCISLTLSCSLSRFLSLSLCLSLSLSIVLSVLHCMTRSCVRRGGSQSAVRAAGWCVCLHAGALADCEASMLRWVHESLECQLTCHQWNVSSPPILTHR